MTTDILEDDGLEPRLNALKDAAKALGMAIRGVGPNPALVANSKELCDELLMVCKRISWVEKTADPTWKPYEERDKTGKTPWKPTKSSKDGAS